MKRLITLILLLSIFLVRVSAQVAGDSGDVKQWTLKECMFYALENSPKNQIQQLSNDSRRIDRREATLNFLPSVSGSAGASTNYGRQTDESAGTYTNTTSLYNSYQLQAGLTIFNGFAILNNFRISKIAQMSGIEESRLIEDDICLNIIQSYFNVLYRIGMVKITEEQLEESMQNLKKTRVMEEMGLKSHADLLQIEAQVATNDYNYIREQNSLKQAIITLKKYMFFPADEELILAEFDPDANIVDVTDFVQNSFEQVINELPRVKIADYKVNISALNLKKAQWSILPSLSAYAGYSTNYYNNYNSSVAPKVFGDQLRDNQGQYVQLSMSIPIFNSLVKHNNIARRRNDLKIAERERDQVKMEIEFEVERAVQDLEGAAKEFIQAEKRADAQEVAHQSNIRKFEEGIISVIDLQNSANMLLSSKAERLNSALTYVLKGKVVNYYKGTPYLMQ